MKLLDKFINKELELAYGCTEPGAVAYAVASANKYLEGGIQELIVEMDGFVYKNGMDTGIPGVTDIKGNKAAAALGLFASDPERKKLKVLSGLSEESIEKAKNILDKVEFKVVDRDDLYIHAILIGENRVESLIKMDHSNLKWIKVDGETIWQKEKTIEDQDEGELIDRFKSLRIQDMVDLIEKEFNAQHLKLLKDGLDCNMRLVKDSKEGMGAGIGRHYQELAANDEVKNIAALISHGVDARMSGVSEPALASSGSGNQGITISIGIYYTGKLLNYSEEEIFKATLLGHIIAYYTKIFIGKLSSLCGLFYAAAPAILTGLLYLDGRVNQIENGINNLFSEAGGILCDGAKSSCAFKAINSYESAYRHYQFIKSGLETCLPTGYISDSLEKTLQNQRSLSEPRNRTVNETLFKIIEKNLSA